MARPENRSNDGNREGGRSERRDGDRSGGDKMADLVTSSALRIGLGLIGFILLLFALGQAVGFDLLGLLVDAVTSQIGRWLVVAFFALVLIAVALRGFTPSAEE